MHYCNEIVRQIGVVNQVLIELNVLPLFDNVDFFIDELSFENYLSLTYRGWGKIGFNFRFSLDGFEMDIDRAKEVFFIKLDDLDKSYSELRDFLFMLFRSRIVVEYCGESYTKVIFIDTATAKSVGSIKFVCGWYLKLNCTSKEYPPISGD